MYESLLYLQDLRLQLEIAEELYISIKVDKGVFYNKSCSDYYLNKKNMM